MLTRSIELYSSDLTIEEKFIRGVKRICIVFAIAAVTLAATDIAQIGAVGNAAAYVHNNRFSVADLPDRLRSGFELISYTSDEPSVTVAIPRENFNVAARPATIAQARNSKSNTSVVAKLAATRMEDAVSFAMALPAPLAKPEPRLAAAFAAVAPPKPIIYASADIDGLPQSVGPTPVSLPMSNTLPLDMVPMPRAAPGVPPPLPAQRLHLEGKDYA